MALEPHLARMRAYADAAREHPTWSVAYAEDVPMLLAELERLRTDLAQPADRGHALRKAESDLALCRADVERLRMWLTRIAEDQPETTARADTAAAVYQVWAIWALEGRDH